MNQQSEIQSPRMDDQPLPGEQVRNQQRTLSLITNVMKQTKQIQIVVLLFQLLFILFNSYIAFDLSYKISILYTTVLLFLHIVRIGIYNNKLNREYGCCLRIFWGLALISYEGCLIYYAENQSFPIQNPIIFVCTYTLFWFVYQMKRYSILKTNKSLLELVFIFLRLLIVGEILLINLKWQDWIQWDWFSTFIILWIVLSILIVFQIIFLFDLICKTSNLLQEAEAETREQLNSQIIGSIWVNLLILCFNGIPTFTFVSLVLNLEGNQNDLNQMGITLSVLYCLIFIVYTLYYRQTLCAFVMVFQELGGDISNNRGELGGYSSNLVNSPHARKQMVFQEAQHLNKQEVLSRLPVVLLRLSSTYFLAEDMAITDSKRYMKTEFNKQQSQSKQIIKNNSVTEIQLDKQNLCFNCCNAESQAVYMPCGHGGMCLKCAVEWFKEKRECLICRKPVESVIQVIPDVNDNNKVKVIDVVAFR